MCHNGSNGLAAMVPAAAARVKRADGKRLLESYVFGEVCASGDRNGSFRAEAAVGRLKPRNLARKAMR